MTRAAAYFNRHSRLALGDCFALTLAEEIGGSVLLTGDAPLREVAEGRGISTAWVIDELESHGIVPPRRLHDALPLFHADELVSAESRDHAPRRLEQLL
ncbi:MAG: hypothetical protein OXH85_12850 [Truepera sp.]|nr:hypothetical protein [Truepera sp.]